ncbi:MAG: DUF4366 domain-containing protein [Lachnospiraceae bacterium]|nr:DUF4366 domain-containing protein [Lachnospiraceae bacterium]
MKKKLSIKVVLSLVLSAVLFCMPIGAFMANDENTISVKADDIKNTEGETKKERSAEESTKNETGETTKKTTQESPEDATVSQNDVLEQKCTCREKCSQYSKNEECELCKKDYTLCDCVSPNVKITINTPTGWHNETAKVHISVEDVSKTENFTIKTVQAKIGQNGSWTDITEDMYIEISENSTVYVLVTDHNGKTYENNRYMKCFDFDKPTLNAAVSDGLLSIQAHDTASGIKAIYVNGYEFTEITNGVLNIRLQQFDAGYQYFTIQAMDNAGNMSEVYKTANPYYTDPEAEDSNESNPAEQLPVNAEATNPSSATAQVTEHTKTDSEGNQIVSSNAGSGSDKQTSDSDTEVDEEKGKEFYTIQTANEKVFYLIIDRDGDEEMVYFLTEISENDLLNTTTENSETLPKNSAALESAIPVSGGALDNNNVEGVQADGTENAAKGDGTEENPEGTEVPEEEMTKENSMTTYIILGILAVVIIGVYYFKVIRKKEDFLDEDEDDEEYEEEEEENEDAEEDFFDQTEDSEE